MADKLNLEILRVGFSDRMTNKINSGYKVNNFY